MSRMTWGPVGTISAVQLFALSPPVSQTPTARRLIGPSTVVELVCTTAQVPIVTIALCQSETLGGGFEAALSSDVIIAEEGARFGLPEVLFNLFPGMGAYSFLARRIGVAGAEEMIFSGKVYSAAELKEMGVVDMVAPDGEGRHAVHAYIDRHRRHFTAHRALYKVRRRFSPVSYQELTDIVTIWVDAALELLLHVERQLVHPPDHAEADVVAQQRVELQAQVALEQRHERRHLGLGPLPVLD